MSVWTYTPGGTKLGDRIMAMKPFMYERGGQKFWNELFTFANRAFSTNMTLSGGRTTFGEIDLNATADVTTAVPRGFADPMAGRQMPGYPTGTTQVFIFDGFSG